MRIPRPFEGIYGVSLPTPILALVPYIILASAYAELMSAGEAGFLAHLLPEGHHVLVLRCLDPERHSDHPSVPEHRGREIRAA